MTIIGLLGRKQSGKDTCATILGELAPFKRVAFADRLRKAYYDLNPIVAADLIGPLYLQEVVDEIGWDRAKEEYPEIRRGLQRFGTEMGRDNFGKDFWVDLAWEKVAHWEGHPDPSNYVITDVRFENEIAKVKAWKGELWRIERDDQAPDDPDDPLMQHSSEKVWRDTPPHVTIHNPGNVPGGLEQYRAAIKWAWTSPLWAIR